MARPKKEQEITHTHHINLRLTDVQYEVITERAKQANLSLSEYIRRQLIKGKVTVKYELVADLPELEKLIAEFGKIGSNLNQIAKHFNSGGIHSQEIKNQLNESIADIFEMRCEVLKLAGNFTAFSKPARNTPGENSHGNTKTSGE